MNRATQMLGACLAAAVGLMALGCSGSATQAPQFDAVTGAHPTGWIQNHWEAFIQNPTQCATCHGSTSDPATSGGIAKVSCFTCHANGPWHPQGWSDPSQHGRNGAMLAPVATDSTTVPVMAGFAHCAKCHGSEYTNPIGVTPSCTSCHTKAPHPDKSVWAAVPTNVTDPNHMFTNQANAPECFKCHANGNNSDMKPATPAPVGTEPGCFNGTLCHTTNVTGGAVAAGVKVSTGTN